MAYYSILQYSTSCYLTLQHTKEYKGMPWRTTVYYRQQIMLHHNTAYYGIIGHVMAYYITVCYITLQHTTE